MDVHVLHGIISSGVFSPRKDKMAQTTHVISKKYKSLPQGLLNILHVIGMEWHNA